MTKSQLTKCNVAIHTASVASGAAGAIPIPVADALPITGAQVLMVIALGKVFDQKITESAAKGLIGAAASTFVGRNGLYLEDLFVYPEYRGRGYGKALFLELVKIAHERNCGRMEWVCLNWNTPSIEFYKSMVAIPLDEWTTYRLDEAALNKLL